MARNGHTFAKRQREQEKRAKAAAKRARRQDRKQGADVSAHTDTDEPTSDHSVVD